MIAVGNSWVHDVKVRAVMRVNTEADVARNQTGQCCTRVEPPLGILEAEDYPDSIWCTSTFMLLSILGEGQGFFSRLNSGRLRFPTQALER
jgi:hypothetical protein